MPPTPGEVERLAQLGQRGEALVYRMEIERVRAMGHTNPEQFVDWISQREPGADHDIRSIDENGLPRFIEVKSTTGIDGRFEWPRKEFERALRERDRYELWRVYGSPRKSRCEMLPQSCEDDWCPTPGAGARPTAGQHRGSIVTLEGLRRTG